MNIVSQIFIIILILIFDINIIYKLKHSKIDYRFALMWLFAGIIMLVFSIFPQLLALLSNFLGIAIPLNLVFFLGVILALYLIFTLMISYTSLNKKLIQLTQEISILEHELKYSKEKINVETIVKTEAKKNISNVDKE